MNLLQSRLLKLSSVTLFPIAFFKAVKILYLGLFNKTVVISLVQHIGDNVAAEPLEVFLREQNQEKRIIRIIEKKYLEIVENRPFYDKIITVSCLSEWIYLRRLIKRFIKIYDLHIDGAFCKKYRLTFRSLKKTELNIRNYYEFGNLLQVFCVNAGVKQINEKPTFWQKPFLKADDLPEKYFVIHIKSNDEEREWEIGKWELLIDFIFTNTSYSIIEIGITSDLTINNSRFINFCGKLSFSQISLVISKGALFIGIDSAFAHFANCYPVPKVVLLGTFSGLKNYLPYSGLSPKEQEDTILRFDGKVKDIKVSDVIIKIRNLLKL